MLILSRCSGESLHVVDEVSGEQIRILIDRIYGNRCRVGIEAAPRFRIHRSELLEQLGLLTNDSVADGPIGATAQLPRANDGPIGATAQLPRALKVS